MREIPLLLDYSRTPETTTAIMTLLQLYRNGLDKGNPIGYHGCSLETIEYAIQQGNIPGGRSSTPGIPPRSLYFAAITPDAFEHTNPDEEERAFARRYGSFHTKEAGFKKAHYFAKNAGSINRFIALLGLDLSSGSIHSDANNLFMDARDWRAMSRREARTFFHKKGFTDKDLAHAMHESRKRKGVILGVKKTLVEDFPVIGAHGPEDYGVVSDHGFSLDYFTGLQCIGPEEETFFKQLEATFGNLSE